MTLEKNEAGGDIEARVAACFDDIWKKFEHVACIGCADKTNAASEIPPFTGSARNGSKLNAKARIFIKIRAIEATTSGSPPEAVAQQISEAILTRFKKEYVTLKGVYGQDLDLVSKRRATLDDYPAKDKKDPTYAPSLTFKDALADILHTHVFPDVAKEELFLKDSPFRNH
jgi:hypothetical protein